MSNYYQNFKNVIGVKRDAFLIVLIYSIVISLLSLSLPIAVQTLVNMVEIGSSGKQILVLCIVLFVLLILAFIVRILQYNIVENIQQSIFVRVALRISKHVNRIALRNYKEKNVTEFVNRLFEVVTVQKSVSILFLTILEVILQSIASMVLLAFYHPVLLIYDIVLVFFVLLAIILPYRHALKEALKESTARHDVVGWVEDQASNPMIFRSANNGEYAVERTDRELTNYTNCSIK